MSHFVTRSSLLVELSDSEFPPTMMGCLQENCDGNHLSFFVCFCNDSVGVFSCKCKSIIYLFPTIITQNIFNVQYVHMKNCNTQKLIIVKINDIEEGLAGYCGYEEFVRIFWEPIFLHAWRILIRVRIIQYWLIQIVYGRKGLPPSIWGWCLESAASPQIPQAPKIREQNRYTFSSWRQI